MNVTPCFRVENGRQGQGGIVIVPGIPEKKHSV